MTLAALIVNPESNVADCFDHGFGGNVSLTRYSRPIEDGHPRMSVSMPPHFDVVVVDLQTWVSGKTDLEVLESDLPEWLASMIREAAGKSCTCVIISTNNVYAPVYNLIKASGAAEIYLAAFGGVQSAEVAQFVEGCWRAWDASNRKPSGSPQGPRKSPYV